MKSVRSLQQSIDVLFSYVMKLHLFDLQRNVINCSFFAIDQTVTSRKEILFLLKINFALPSSLHCRFNEVPEAFPGVLIGALIFEEI